MIYKKLKRYIVNIFTILFVMTISSCKVNYSFTGASIAPDVKTVSIQYFQNTAPIAPNNINQVFTEALKDIISTQTNLSAVPKYGDVRFEGTVSSYSVSPLAVQSVGGSNSAQLNRLTIIVDVKFENTKDDKLSYSQSFSNFADFSASTNLTTEQTRLVKDISQKIVQDIFTKSFVNW